MRRASFWMLSLTYGCVGVRATARISERTHAACRKTTCSSSKPRCKSSAAWAKRRKQGRRSAVTVFLGCIGKFASWTSARSVRWTTSSWAATRHALGVVQAPFAPQFFAFPECIVGTTKPFPEKTKPMQGWFRVGHLGKPELGPRLIFCVAQASDQ